ncbi:hypothetical protein ACFLZG_01990 [Thermodesulfobacteriota bacterium]
MPKKPTNEELVQRVRELELDETDHEKAEATPRENEELKNHMIKKKQLNSVLARLQWKKDIFPLNN